MNENQLNYIKIEIENTRNMLNQLIEEKNGDLLDSEVIELSEFLDQLISEYDHIKK